MDKLPTSKFIKIMCTKCKNEQTVFSKPAQDVTCLVCGSKLVESGGGNGNIKAKVLGTM